MKPDNPEHTLPIEQEQKKHGNYLMLLPLLPMRRISPESFAIERMLGMELLKLQERIRSKFDKLIIVAPMMPEDTYNLSRKHLLEINEGQTGIYFEHADMGGVGLRSLFRSCIKPEFYRSYFKIIRLVKCADLVYGGPSYNIYPTPFSVGFLYAIFKRKKTIFWWEGDLRSMPRRMFKMKVISLKGYLWLWLVCNVISILELKIAIKFCSLVIVRSKKIISDFAKGKNSVKRDLYSALTEGNIIPDGALAGKISLLQNKDAPIELIYFGRLVPYKAVDLSIRAVKLARDMGGNVTFSVFGDGSEKEKLLRLVDNLSLKDNVKFYDSLPYGQELFQKLYKYHILLATPLREDIPRNALDAMGSGMAVLAFDLRYYKEDIFESGAVSVTAWPSVGEMARRIVYFDKNRNELQELMKKAVVFARNNMQEIWLDKHVGWILALFEKPVL